jgi:hypothetical protein
MLFDNPLKVRVEKPEGKQFGEMMNEMRVWLDSQKIQPAEFKPASKPSVGFEIAFRKTEEAERFRERFGGLRAQPIQ